MLIGAIRADTTGAAEIEDATETIGARGLMNNGGCGTAVGNPTMADAAGMMSAGADAA